MSVVRLNRNFYLRPTLDVARELLGKVFVYRDKQLLSGRIVEVEAYIGQDDPACHARFGKTSRNAVMFGQGGFTYVYFIYGMYDMLNFVCEREGFPAACLVRALEPLEGIELMKKRRGTDDIVRLTSGPGKLTRAFGLTVAQSGLDLVSDGIYVADDGFVPDKIGQSPRIGIKTGLDLKWRFFIEGNKFVSKVKTVQTSDG